jgi:hypothetical protein
MPPNFARFLQQDFDLIDCQDDSRKRHRKDMKMSSLPIYILWAGFFAVAAIFVVHFVRDMKAPAQGEEIYEALTRLEEKSNLM